MLVGVALALGLAPGCLPKPRLPLPPPAALVRLDRHPPLLDDGDPATLAAAIRTSLEFYARLPPERLLAIGSERIPVARMHEALAALARFVDTRPSADALAHELDRRFRVYGAPAGVLYTGYYLPLVEAREVRDERFRFAVLGRPADLVTVSLADFGGQPTAGATLVGRVDRGRLVPYAARAEIEASGAPNAPVLAWVDDPVALFFLQIQGTGWLAFADGSRRLVGFGASNGQPYVSIGKLLVAEGKLAAEEASMAGIRRWVAAHPEERDRVLYANPRYVFFRPLAEKPLGSLGIAVTGGRTIATDPAVYPPGVLGFAYIPAKAGVAAADEKLSRLVLNQDAGMAIRGPGRVDVFFGDGAEAEARAGRLRASGDLYVLAPRTDAD
ncbi:MAG: murein transglycosylase A [Deltaproteobacteria bacterium]|nr:murein transglycosylase A [Deltaproteobacteria bacterium]